MVDVAVAVAVHTFILQYRITGIYKCGDACVASVGHDVPFYSFMITQAVNYD